MIFSRQPCLAVHLQQKKSEGLRRESELHASSEQVHVACSAWQKKSFDLFPTLFLNLFARWANWSICPYLLYSRASSFELE